MYRYFIFIVLISQILISCQSGAQKEDKNNQNISDSIASPLSIRHAKGFQVAYYKGYKILTVKNPWQGAQNTKFEYILASDNAKIESNLANIPIIHVPIKKMVCLSTTHIGMIDFLGESASIVGVSGLLYVNNQFIQNRAKLNLVKEVGFDQNLNYELLISMKPDVVMVFGVGSEASGYVNKLKELKINVIFNAEYLEETPLAKAEWLKMVSMLYNKESLAETEFSLMEKEYQLWKNKAALATKKPSVLAALPYKDVWYVPGGKSYVAQLINDAGGDYLWKNETSRESIPFSIEKVVSVAKEADIWINTGIADNQKQIYATDERLKVMKAYQKKALFNNNAIKNNAGGIDYFESGLVKPQIILKDLIKIFHPELMQDYQFVFYKKLE